MKGYTMYEETGKKINKNTGKNAQDYDLRNVSVKAMLLHIAKRHKFALVVTYAVILTIYLFLPFLPGEIMSLLGV